MAYCVINLGQMLDSGNSGHDCDGNRKGLQSDAPAWLHVAVVSMVAAAVQSPAQFPRVVFGVTLCFFLGFTDSELANAPRTGSFPLFVRGSNSRGA